MDDNIASFSDVFNKLKQEIKDCCKDELTDGNYSDDEYDDDSDALDIAELSDTDDVLASLTIDLPDTSRYPNTGTMQQDEKEFIDSCENHELRSLLIMNRTKRLLLLELLDHVSKFKIEFKDVISQIRENEKTKEKVHKDALSVWRVGYPYFKDKNGFPAPRNDDIIRKSVNGELMVYELNKPSGWFSVEQTRLMRAIELNYKMNKELELNKKIKSEDDERSKRMLLNRLTELKRNQEYPPLWSDQHLNWRRISLFFLARKHTEAECRTYWNLFIHPNINKSEWTPEEDETLTNLVEKYHYQNWDQITLELDNNRSPLLACMHFFKTYCQKYKVGTFTYREDRKLVKLVNQYKKGNFIPWVEISRHFVNRSRAQIYHRYIRYLQKTPQRGKFSPAENILLMVLVDKCGKKFTKCAEYFPTRTAAQLKSRYTVNLQQSIKKGHWTEEDDNMILKHVKTQGAKNYAMVAAKLGRTPPQVRQRFGTIVEFLRKHPGKTMNHAMKNKRTRDYPDNFNHLRSIADTFKDSSTIPTLDEIQAILTNFDPTGSDCEEASDIKPPREENRTYKLIDDMLIDFFTFNSFEGPTRATAEDIPESAERLDTLLNDFRVNLEIPGNLEQNLHLDSVDKQLLTILRARKKNPTRNKIHKVIPPNFRTLLCLNHFLLYRSYIDQYASTLTVCKTVSKLRNPRNKLQKVAASFLVEEEGSQTFEMDANLFHHRFTALLRSAAVAASLRPREELYDFVADMRPVRKAIYTYSKNGRCGDPAKRVKSEIPSGVKILSSVTKGSVIENIINKKRKFYSLHPKEGKVLVKKIDLGVNTSNNVAESPESSVISFTFPIVSSDLPAITSPARLEELKNEDSI